MSRNVIRDGQTRKFHIKPETNLHEGLTGEYRPMLPEQVMRLESEVEKVRVNDAGGESLAIADALQRHVTSWSEVDEKSKAVPVDFDALRRLPLTLLRALHFIVAGVRASDPIPTEAATKDRLAELRAMADGKPPGQVALVESQGN
jgi:hypothetical protein